DIFVSVEQIAVIGEPTMPGVVRVDPVTGAQAIVTRGGFFLGAGIYGIAVDSRGDILASNGPGIIRVDPVTGSQAVVVLTADTGFARDVAAVPGRVAAVPEPSAALLLGVGAAALVLCRGARRRGWVRSRA